MFAYLIYIPWVEVLALFLLMLMIFSIATYKAKGK